MRKAMRESTKPLQQALDDLFNRLGLRKKLREYDAVARWEAVVGEQVARVTSAVKIEQGVLTIRVSNGPWRSELVLLKAEIIRKMNSALGDDIVRDIRFL